MDIHLPAEYANKRQLVFSLKNDSVDSRNPLPFRRLSAKPHRRKRLWGID